MKFKNKPIGVFRSTLEKRISDVLIEEGVEYEYEKTVFTLLPSFVYDTSKIRPITYKPDFMGKGWLIEVKGLETPDFKLKWKMLKKYLHDRNDPLKLYLIKSVKELKAILPELLSGQNKVVLRKRKSVKLDTIESSESKVIQKVQRVSRLPRATNGVSPRLSAD